MTSRGKRACVSSFFPRTQSRASRGTSPGRPPCRDARIGPRRAHIAASTYALHAPRTTTHRILRGVPDDLRDVDDSGERSTRGSTYSGHLRVRTSRESGTIGERISRHPRTPVRRCRPRSATRRHLAPRFATRSSDIDPAAYRRGLISISGNWAGRTKSQVVLRASAAKTLLRPR